MKVLFNKDYSFSTNGFKTVHALDGETLEVDPCARLKFMLEKKICTQVAEEEVEEADESNEDTDEEVEEVADDLTEVYKIGEVGAAELAKINVKSFKGLFAFGQTDDGRNYLIDLKGITANNVNRVIDSAKVLAEQE